MTNPRELLAVIEEALRLENERDAEVARVYAEGGDCIDIAERCTAARKAALAALPALRQALDHGEAREVALREEIMWWAGEHRCCAGHEADVFRALDMQDK